MKKELNYLLLQVGHFLIYLIIYKYVEKIAEKLKTIKTNLMIELFS